MNITDILTATPSAYAGIGSRETPADVISLMTRIAEHLCRLGWILRSGAAPGADTAFEIGVLNAAGDAHGHTLRTARGAEIYLPWPRFERDRLPDGRSRIPSRLGRATNEASEVAAVHHPYWAKLKPTVRPLHARNAHQVLGARLDDPSRFVTCWTHDGADGTSIKTTVDHGGTGGTGQAIRIAAAYGVPVFNLFHGDVRAEFERWLT